MDSFDHKNDRGKEVVRQAASEFIQKETNGQSLITVTNISSNKDFKKATVFVTVFPEHKEEAALDFLKRQRREFKDYIKKNTKLSRIPHFDFAIDLGDKSRQRVEELI